MTPFEIGILIESHRPKQVGGIVENDLYDLHERRNAIIDQGGGVL
jgi:hypothetical protein